MSQREEEISRFLSEINAGPATQRTYANALKQLDQFLSANYASTRPRKQDLLDFREMLRKAGKKAATIQLYFVAIRRFYGWRQAEGLSKTNPAAGIKGARLPETFIRGHLEAWQVKQLLSRVDRSSLAGKRDYALICLMVCTGLRCCEAARAKIEDIRNRSSGKVLYIQGKGHESKDAFVKLPDTVQKALEAYLNARKAQNPTESLFMSLSRRKSPFLSVRSIGRIIKQHLLKAGLTDPMLSAHSLRHTAATLNLEASSSLEETRILLRHKSLVTTQRYCHYMNADKNPSEQRISEIIFG